MILRVLNLQGIVGLVATLALLGLLLTQKAETGHWRKQSNAFERLYHANRRLSREVSQITGPRPTPLARPTVQLANVHVSNRIPSMRGRKMNSRLALPMLALTLSACAGKVPSPQPIAAVAEARQCPAYPLPPEALLKPPAKTDFLPKTR